jgi:PadR family transcriptional regulator PadR
MKYLTSNETEILLAILDLEKEAYGVAIKKYISKYIDRKISYGTLYSYLDQLFRKGLISKSLGTPTAERGGRSKIYYKLTKDGLGALESVCEHQKLIWSRFSKVSFHKA